MTTQTPSSRALLALAIALPACTQEPPEVTQAPAPEASKPAAAAAPAPAPAQTRRVAGSAVHFFTTAMIHSQEESGNGKTQRSTDIVKLSGDLAGYVLYQPTSVFDFAAGTLVNTGRQYFSGTVLGGEPVVLYDDAFRFDVNFAAGNEHGEVHLRRTQDARGTSWYECDLEITGTGEKTPAGDGIVHYTGECRRYDTGGKHARDASLRAP